MSPEYAQKMISMGFKLVTIGADQRYMSAGAKTAVDKIKQTLTKDDSKTY
jgi:4-hydroxy-2-oxoheptanedioate aldolase